MINEEVGRAPNGISEPDFIKRHKSYWMKLSELISLTRSKGYSALSPDDIKEVGRLYRKVSADLSYASTHLPGSRSHGYLNSLVIECHTLLTMPMKPNPRNLIRILTIDFPAILSKCRTYFLISALIFILSVFSAFAATVRNRSIARYFLPPEFLVSDERMNASGDNAAFEGKNLTVGDSSVFASAIMTNNIQVSFLALATGIFLGVGTAYILALNGAMLGSLSALFYLNGESYIFWSLILPHGVIELTAIFISAAAGLLIATAIINPGDRYRKDAIISNGRLAAILIAGVVFLLIIAGIIEGFFTPAPIDPLFKYIFALFTLIFLIGYLSFSKSTVKSRA
jgi:uncharacterized membrane protein SpoIIM required for sporulation